MTASDLNAEFVGKITNENDLDTRLTTEVTARTTLEAEFDILNAINKLWTYQNTAPSGWNIVASTTDALLACKGGANAYNTTGGQQIGTWTQPNHLHTTGDHALSIAELAAHTHGRPTCVLGIQSGGGSGAGTVYGAGAYTSYQASRAGSSTGSGTAHNHGNTGNSATAATYRPLANLGIVIEKT